MAQLPKLLTNFSFPSTVVFPSTITVPLSQARPVTPYRPPSGAAERAVRTGLGVDPAARPNAPALPNKTVEDRLIRDVVALGARADQMVNTYGSDRRLVTQQQDILRNLDPNRLGAIGNGRDYTLAAPTSTTSRGTLSNGLTRETTVDTAARSVDYTKADAASGTLGSVRTFTERVVTTRDLIPAGTLEGQTEEAAAGPTVRRAETTEELTFADLEAFTQTRLTAQRAVITSSADTNIRAEERLTATLYRVREDGQYERLVYERFFSVTTNQDGSEILASTERETLTSALVNSDGDVTIQTQQDQSSVQRLANGAIASSSLNVRRREELDGYTTDAGQYGVLQSRIAEQVTTSSGRLNADGSASVSTTDRRDLFIGDGENVISAQSSISSESASRRADGTISASATTKRIGFALGNDEIEGNGRDALTLLQASAVVQSVSATLRPNGVATLRASDDRLSVRTRDGVLGPVRVASADPVQVTVNTAALPSAVPAAPNADRPGNGKGRSNEQANSQGNNGLANSQAVAAQAAAGRGRVITSDDQVVSGPLAIIPGAGDATGQLRVQVMRNNKGPQVTLNAATGMISAQTGPSSGGASAQRDVKLLEAYTRNQERAARTNIEGDGLLSIAKAPKNQGKKLLALGAENGTLVRAGYDPRFPNVRATNSIVSLIDFSKTTVVIA